MEAPDREIENRSRKLTIRVSDPLIDALLHSPIAERHAAFVCCRCRVWLPDHDLESGSKETPRIRKRTRPAHSVLPEIDKGDSMNRIGVFALLSAATMFPLASSLVAEQQLNAKVPFAFSVANRILPAGEYLIRQDGSFLRIENLDDFQSATLISIPGERSADGRAYLSFDEVNGVHFLRGVSTQDDRRSVEVPRSKARELARQAREQRDQRLTMNEPQR